MPPTTTTKRPVGDAQLRGAKAKTKSYRIVVDGGLYLEVATNGSKLWRWKYRLAGKENRYAIGPYPAVLLKEAKEKRDEARKLVKVGIHPSHQKKLDQIRQKTEHANSFEAVAREWIEANSGQWTPRTARWRRNLLAREVYPWIGALPARKVEPAHVLELLQRVEVRSPVMAGFAKQIISAVSRYAVATRRADQDPTIALRGALKKADTKNHRPLTREELPRFIRAVDEGALSLTSKIAVALTMLTLARSQEIIRARWEEFDPYRALWTVPAERMKMREPHLVPLPSQAVELLRKLHAVTGQREHLFPNRTKPKKPASNSLLGRAVAELGFEDFSPHGIRSTGSTMLNEMGFRADLLEKQLAHEQRNASRRAYDRSTLVEERRQMMQQWANHLDQVAAGNDNVVPLHAKRG